MPNSAQHNVRIESPQKTISVPHLDPTLAVRYAQGMSITRSLELPDAQLPCDCEDLSSHAAVTLHREAQ